MRKTVIGLTGLNCAVAPPGGIKNINPIPEKMSKNYRLQLISVHEDIYTACTLLQDFTQRCHRVNLDYICLSRSNRCQ